MYLTNNELAAFFEQMAMILHSGISPIEGIAIMKDDAYTREGGILLQKIYEGIEESGSLYTSLSESGVFPSYALQLIHIGEETGHLENVMSSLSGYYQREEEVKQNIKSAVSYPLIMLGMMFIIILILIMKVLPMFNQVFVQLGGEMSGFSLVLMNIGTTLSNYSFVFIVILLLIAAALLYFNFSPSGIRARGKAAAHFFLTRELIEKMAVSKFAAGMSLTLGSGLNAIESLQMAEQLISHPVIKQRIQACQNSMNDGIDFSEALSESGIFSGIYSKMASIGYKTGALDILMEKISIQYEDEINQRMNRLISILEPTLVAVLSVIVGLILLSVMLPLLGIMTNIG